MTTEQSIPALRASPAWSTTLARPRESWYLLVGGLVVGDGLALGEAFALAYLIRFKAGIPLLETPPHQIAFYSSIAFWAIPLWLMIFGLYRLYDRHSIFVGFQEYTRVVNACTAGMLVLIVISFLDLTLIISRGWLLLTWFLSICLVSGYRFGIRRVLRRLRRDGWFVTPTIIVGANEEGTALAEQFLANPGSGTRIVGFVDDEQSTGTRVIGELAVVASLGSLEQVVRQWGVKELIIATTALTRDQLLDVYRVLGHDESVELRLSSGLFEILTTSVRVQEVSCVPLMTPQRSRITEVDAILKTTLDYLITVPGLIILSPLLGLIALLVKLDSPGPVFHRRRVLGRSGKPFDALKFRTMVVDADEVLARDSKLRETYTQGQKLKADPRVTRFGRVLRRTSLDELPQLVNVLRGEMSLVGPRMISPEETARYGKWQLNLLTVKPGITGPWQVHGRSDLPYDERVRLSMQYIRNYTIWLDLEILLRTIPAVLRARGAY